MQITCRISDRCLADMGEFCVILPVRGERSKIIPYDTFEKAYLAACEHVNWKLSCITIEVYPQYVKDVLSKVTKDRVKMMMKDRQAKDRAEYERLKKRFDPEPDVTTVDTVDE